MSASRTRVLKRVTEILNLCTAGDYSATLSTRNKTRNADAIADATDEAGLMILKAIAERPNEYRYQFLFDQSITNSGEQLDPHIGPPSRVLIEPYDGGTPVEGKQTNYQKIDSYRNDTEGVYDETAHDEEGSSLSGMFDVWTDRFYFTGARATVSLARLPVRADNTTLIPEVLENTWIRLAVGEAGKVGTGGYEANLINGYWQRGMADLAEFKTGVRNFKETDDPEPTSEVHT